MEIIPQNRALSLYAQPVVKSVESIVLKSTLTERRNALFDEREKKLYDTNKLHLYAQHSVGKIKFLDHYHASFAVDILDRIAFEATYFDIDLSEYPPFELECHNLPDDVESLGQFRRYAEFAYGYSLDPDEMIDVEYIDETISHEAHHIIQTLIRDRFGLSVNFDRTLIEDYPIALVEASAIMQERLYHSIKYPETDLLERSDQPPTGELLRWLPNFYADELFQSLQNAGVRREDLPKCFKAVAKMLAFADFREIMSPLNIVDDAVDALFEENYQLGSDAIRLVIAADFDGLKARSHDLSAIGNLLDKASRGKVEHNEENDSLAVRAKLSEDERERVSSSESLFFQVLLDNVQQSIKARTLLRDVYLVEMIGKLDKNGLKIIT